MRAAKSRLGLTKALRASPHHIEDGRPRVNRDFNTLDELAVFKQFVKGEDERRNIAKGFSNLQGFRLRLGLDGGKTPP